MCQSLHAPTQTLRAVAMRAAGVPHRCQVHKSVSYDALIGAWVVEIRRITDGMFHEEDRFTRSYGNVHVTIDLDGEDKVKFHDADADAFGQSIRFLCGDGRGVEVLNREILSLSVFCCVRQDSCSSFFAQMKDFRGTYVRTDETMPIPCMVKEFIVVLYNAKKILLVTVKHGASDSPHTMALLDQNRNFCSQRLLGKTAACGNTDQEQRAVQELGSPRDTHMKASVESCATGNTDQEQRAVQELGSPRDTHMKATVGSGGTEDAHMSDRAATPTSPSGTASIAVSPVMGKQSDTALFSELCNGQSRKEISYDIVFSREAMRGGVLPAQKLFYEPGNGDAKVANVQIRYRTGSEFASGQQDSYVSSDSTVLAHHQRVYDNVRKCTTLQPQTFYCGTDYLEMDYERFREVNYFCTAPDGLDATSVFIDTLVDTPVQNSATAEEGRVHVTVYLASPRQHGHSRMSRSEILQNARNTVKQAVQGVLESIVLYNALVHDASDRIKRVKLPLVETGVDICMLCALDYATYMVEAISGVYTSLQSGMGIYFPDIEFTAGQEAVKSAYETLSQTVVTSAGNCRSLSFPELVAQPRSPLSPAGNAEGAGSRQKLPGMPDRSSVSMKESVCVFSQKSGLAFRMVFSQHEFDTYAKEKGLWKNDTEKKKVRFVKDTVCAEVVHFYNTANRQDPTKGILHMCSVDHDARNGEYHVTCFIRRASAQNMNPDEEKEHMLNYINIIQHNMGSYEVGLDALPLLPQQCKDIIRRCYREITFPSLHTCKHCRRFKSDCKEIGDCKPECEQPVYLSRDFFGRLPAKRFDAQDIQCMACSGMDDLLHLECRDQCTGSIFCLECANNQLCVLNGTEKTLSCYNNCNGREAIVSFTGSRNPSIHTHTGRKHALRRIVFGADAITPESSYDLLAEGEEDSSESSEEDNDSSESYTPGGKPANTRGNRMKVSDSSESSEEDNDSSESDTLGQRPGEVRGERRTGQKGKIGRQKLPEREEKRMRKENDKQGVSRSGSVGVDGNQSSNEKRQMDEDAFAGMEEDPFAGMEEDPFAGMEEDPFAVSDGSSS